MVFVVFSVLEGVGLALNLTECKVTNDKKNYSVYLMRPKVLKPGPATAMPIRLLKLLITVPERNPFQAYVKYICIEDRHCPSQEMLPVLAKVERE